MKIDQKLKTASRELHCLSADGEFIMSGGTLTANTSGTKSACIYVSDANTAGAGIKITGGTLDLTAYAYSRGALTLNLSTQNEATKALLIEGGTTSIYCTNKTGGTGIYLMGKNVVYTMAGGKLTVDAQGGLGCTGITNYNGRGKVNIVFKGGETEIISDVALSTINSVTFDENYIHKNYAGSSKEVTPDNNILNVNGNIRKDYLLVTPAYKITYNVPDDCTLPNGLPTVYSKYDSAIAITGTPTRPAYSFTGWTGNNGTTPQTNVTIPAGSTGDKEYTANWDGQEYTVYFYSNFEPGTYQTQTFKYGEEKALNENPFTREGYDFTGWNTVGQPTSDNPGTSYADKGNLLINTALDENQLKLWAQWRIRSHTISYAYSNPAPDGAPGVPAIATVAYGSGQTVAAAPTLTGYTFSGWSGKTKTNGDTVAVDGNNAFTMPDDDVEFTGSWTANTYTVVFHANNGTTATSSQSFNYNEEKALTENAFTNGGYGFTGWNTVANPTSDNPGVAYTDKQSVKNLTAENNGTIDLYGQWSVNQHTVSYAYSDPVPDGAPAVPASATVDYGASQSVAAAPTLTGYTFSGWSGKTKTNGDTVAVDGNNAFTMPDDDVEFTGAWTANTYTVTLVTNGGAINSGNVTGYTYGVGATLPADVTQTGHTFLGWFDNEGLTGTPVTAISTEETGDRQYWAKWGINQHTITFVNEDGTVLQSSPVNDGTTPSYAGEMPIKAEDAQYTYTFAGWTPEVTAVNDNATYTATYTHTPKTYTVTLNTNGGTIVDGEDVISYTYGTEVTLPETTDITKTGYTFTGWYDNSGFSGDAITQISNDGTGDKEFWAKWTPIAYAINVTDSANGSFAVKAGETADATTAFMDDTVTLTLTPDTGYELLTLTVDGEDKTGEISGNVYSFTMPAHDVTVTVTYAANPAATHTLTINYVYADSTQAAEPHTETLAEGAEYAVTSLTIEGFTPDQATVSGSMGTEDVTVTVTYTANAEEVIQYTVIEGNGQTYVKESGTPLSFRAHRNIDDEKTYGLFKELKADGNPIAEQDYDKKPGSVIATLKPAYLDTLALGKHTLTFVFEDGEAAATFTVTEAAKPTIIPATGFEAVAVPSKTFTFKKVWEGGSEKSIDFTLYKLGDTVYHHGFDKKVVSPTEWRYNAWFSEAAACYVIEKPVEGYKTRYENVGVYAGITDRCCDGGTIVNYRVPKTGDDANLTLWLGCALAGLTLICAAACAEKRKKAHNK